jgi:hypothetical protein
MGIEHAENKLKSEIQALHQISWSYSILPLIKRGLGILLNDGGVDGGN